MNSESKQAVGVGVPGIELESCSSSTMAPADLVAGIRSDVDLARVFADVEVVVGEQLRGVHAATTFKEGQDKAAMDEIEA